MCQLAWTATAYPEGTSWRWRGLLQPTPKVTDGVHCYSLPRRYRLAWTATAGTGWCALLQPILRVPAGVHRHASPLPLLHAFNSYNIINNRRPLTLKSREAARPIRVCCFSNCAAKLRQLMTHLTHLMFKFRFMRMRQ